AGLLDTGPHALTVAGGTLQIFGGTLTGTGTVKAGATILVTSAGVVAPGGLNTTGTLRVDGNIEFQAGGQFLVDLGAAPDLLQVTGTARLDPESLLAGGTGLLGGTIPGVLLTAAGGLTGAFENTTGPVVLGLDAYTVSYTA